MNPNPLEKEIERAIGIYAVSKGVMYKKFVSPANVGETDRLLVCPGAPAGIGFLEIKRRGKKPTAIQQSKMNSLKAAGCLVHWVDNVADGKLFVDKLISLTNKEKGEDWV